ncbi:unnamed protein product [Enterobius vermicularis]|uniref:CAP-ZIP_m domain-containing protein n=1 Tax=Enterobius vermicularis TaxID=51028 RepID=A0A0N4UT33_ENTVE|nr:unnamed protein product [Enterobius vermicularis]
MSVDGSNTNESLEQHDLLDEVFGAEIHLPEVKGKAITQTEKSDEDESQSSEDEDERRKNVRGEDEELEKESSKGESRESLKSESSSEVEDSSRHDESDVEKDEEEGEYDEEKTKKTDKIAPSRNPENEQSFVEMEQKQLDTNEQKSSEDEEEPSQYVEEDVDMDQVFGASSSQTVGSRVQYNFEAEAESPFQMEETEPPKQEQKAEAFLDYDRKRAEEVMEETISEPNFDIEVASSDYDHDMENFDQQAGLQSSGVHTSETEKSEGTDTGEQKQVLFSELPMDSENRWNQEERQEPDFYDNNVPEAEESEDKSEAHIKFKDSHVSVPIDTFDHSSADKAISAAPGVRNLKSIFESKKSSPSPPKTEHPPVRYDDLYAEEERLESRPSYIQSERREEQNVGQKVEYVESVKEQRFVPNVEVEEQKPVGELLNMFGGRKKPSPRKEVAKQLKNQVPYSKAAVTPAARSYTSSEAPEKGSVPKCRVHSLLEPSKLETSPNQGDNSAARKSPLKKSPIFTSKDQFQSLRVVKNVRQFVKIWGNAYSPDGPHPMSPVDRDKELDYMIQEKPHQDNSHSVPKGEKQERSQNYSEELHSPAAKTEETVGNHTVSSRDKVKEESIENLPVSQRRMMWERRRPRKMSNSPQIKLQHNGQQVSEVFMLVF